MTFAFNIFILKNQIEIICALKNIIRRTAGERQAAKVRQDDIYRIQKEGFH